ncbi:MAG TPA: hypothetical protein VEZ48_01595 [Sphingomonadaceae bacterium]|jgi:hypothetical protein|nr:hypothetical protein [Sphingomonadaceae bacterium]
MAGQVIRRDEQDNRYPAYNRPYENGDPHEIWFRNAGKQTGYTGNNGTTDTDYANLIAARTRAAPTQITVTAANMFLVSLPLHAAGWLTAARRLESRISR